MASPKAILFIGATGGCGLSALRRSLAAGHTCIALCRNPSRLTAHFSDGTPANLRIEQGNAHDVDALARCLLLPPPSAHPPDHPPLSDPAGAANAAGPSRLVDTVVFSIGAYPTLRGMDDPHVCEKGAKALLAALRRCREAVAGRGDDDDDDDDDNDNEDSPRPRRPRLVVVSSTGVTRHGRDVPLPLVPLYRLLLGTAHRDKRAMEAAVVASGEAWTVVRGSLYVGAGEAAPPRCVRVGVEDPVAGVVESRAVGYTISREDVGKWIFEHLIQESDARWVRKAATITY